MENNTNIVRSENKNLPIDVQVASKLRRLSDDIIAGQNDLQDIISSIEDSSLNINIKRNWIGAIKKSSIEETCESIYSNLSGYIKDCGKALQKTNENLGYSLELIKMLAVVEKDLYKQIDTQAVHNNELKHVFLDWCKKEGIKDQEVRDLLEISFNRAYILRDRINSLRNEFCNGIRELAEIVNAVERKQQEFDTIKAELIHKFTSQLQNILDEKLSVFDSKYQDVYQQFVTLAEEKECLLHKIVEENKSFKEEIGNIRKSFKRKTLYTMFVSLLMSGVVSYLIVAFVK